MATTAKTTTTMNETTALCARLMMTTTNLINRLLLARMIVRCAVIASRWLHDARRGDDSHKWDQFVESSHSLGA